MATAIAIRNLLNVIDRSSQTAKMAAVGRPEVICHREAREKDGTGWRIQYRSAMKGIKEIPPNKTRISTATTTDESRRDFQYLAIMQLYTVCGVW